MSKHPLNDSKPALVVWYYGTYDSDSSRNKKLIKSLRPNNMRQMARQPM